MAESTRRNYLSAARLYIQSLEGRAVYKTKYLIGYAYMNLKVATGKWKAHAAGRYRRGRFWPA